MHARSQGHRITESKSCMHAVLFNSVNDSSLIPGLPTWHFQCNEFLVVAEIQYLSCFSSVWHLKQLLAYGLVLLCGAFIFSVELIQCLAFLGPSFLAYLSVSSLVTLPHPTNRIERWFYAHWKQHSILLCLRMAPIDSIFIFWQASTLKVIINIMQRDISFRRRWNSIVCVTTHP